MTHHILFICSSLNQTTQMHQIAAYLSDSRCFFTPFYADGFEDFAARNGWLNSTILGGRHFQETKNYLEKNGLPVDYRGIGYDYDLVVTCTDLFLPKNIQHKRLVLVQEGITVPEGYAYHLVRTLPFLTRYLADTAATGLSDCYDLFCVASEGYRNLFIRKGVRPEKIAVTGIPNFDDLAANLDNPFPHRGYVLVATTPHREALHFEDRMAFLRKCVKIAKGRQLIFKLHPIENTGRARREIASVAPEALVFTHGNVNHMIANADAVITQKSSCTFVAMALGKELHTDLDQHELRRLMPLQNKKDSSRRISTLCRQVLHIPMPVLETLRVNSSGNQNPVILTGHLPRGRWEPPVSPSTR